MKPNKLQKILVCSAIALTLPATAATNPAGSTPPFNGAQTPSTPSGGNGIGGATPPFNGSQNPATAGGQGDIVGGNTDATGGGASNPNGGGSGNTPALPTPIQNESVQDAIETCPLAKNQEDVLEEALRIASIVPDIDEIFNPANEASAGCFAASSKVINLAMEIPSVSFSLTGIGDLVKKNLERILLQKAEEVLNKGCAIADTALLEALDPLQKYFDEYNQRVGDFNGMIGNREMSPDYEYKGVYENASDLLRKRISGTEADISAADDAFAATDKEMRERWAKALEDETFISGGGFGGGYTNNSGTNPPKGSGEAVPPYFGDTPPKPKGSGEAVPPYFGDTPPWESKNAPPPSDNKRTSNPFGSGNKPNGSPF